MGCDLVNNKFWSAKTVSIHAPTWGATSRFAHCYGDDQFQSTHPHGVRPDMTLSYGDHTLFQSTHPHGVRLLHPSGNFVLDTVSIHAPTWGATDKYARINNDRAVSIHAPTWGATRIYILSTCDDWFQSTHPHGVRLSQAQQMPSSRTFQSTHPHGVRRSILPVNSQTAGFNPRTHMGCDEEVEEQREAWEEVSIHAPTWGATQSRRRTQPHRMVSIHAPTWGAT